MDIVIEQVPEVLEQPQLQREVTGRLEDAQEQPDLTATQEDLLNPIEPPPKRRGRPPGSKNKPRIIEQIPDHRHSEEPIVLNEPPPIAEEPPVAEPPKKKPAAPRKPRAPKAQPAAQAPPTTPTAPVPQTPLQIAASMLEILRLEQAERQYRKGQLYKSWVK